MEKSIRLFFIVFLVAGLGAEVGAVASLVSGEMTGGLIATGIGTVFTAIGVIGLVVAQKKNAKLKLLRETGKKVMATIVASEFNTSMTFNGRNPQVLTCETKESISGKMMIFRSGNYWGDLRNLVGSSVPVYYDPRNPDEYAVDTENIILSR